MIAVKLRIVKWLVIGLLGLSIVGPLQANSSAAADKAYNNALQQIEKQQYRRALATLRKLQKRFPAFEHMASVQTRIAVLQESADAGQSLPVFLQALSLRESGDMEAALQALDTIASADPAGTLTDDALYISAYLQVMDRYDFQAARVALQLLDRRFPESAYSDSAQYLDAIALEQLGYTQAASDQLTALRDRHTALNLPLDFRWPKGSVLSRYWFDRADRRLAIVEQRLTGASRLDSAQTQTDGKLLVAVSVQGMDMQLLLLPSPLTRETQWLDGGLASQLPPSIGIFDGVVEGVADSWVRVVLQDNLISGVVNINGEQYKLQPANLKGTLDYYQPRSRKPATNNAHSDLADSVQGLDVLIAPPEELQFDATSRSINVQTDVRAVPVSIVVDSQYDRYYAGGGMAAALNNLNIADGVYRQFGLALTLDEALTFSENADPMQLGAVTLETILRSFRDYRLQYSTLFQDSALTYLFTGNPKTDVTLGLAWIDTACRVDGYDVGVTTPSNFGDVLLSHELGHSLGAQHDTDTACNDDSSALMWPNISERTDIVFSSCSQVSVVQSRAKSCLQNTVNLSLAASSTGATVEFEMTNPDGALTVDAQLVVETSAPDQLQWPAGCQVQAATSAVCYVDSLGPMEQRVLSLVVSDDYQGLDAPVTAQLSPVGVIELQSADNLATASPLGGSSNIHLPVNSPSVTTGIVTSDGVTAVGQPSAASSGGSAGIYWLLIGVLYSICRRLQRGFSDAMSGLVPNRNFNSTSSSCCRSEVTLPVSLGELRRTDN